MPYRRNNYSFTVDSSFNPFTLQEMLVPFTAYKDAYEQTEAAYDDLNQKADTFSYLADVAEKNPESKAAQIYKGYADELHKQADDLAKHGLSMGNRRALTNLKRRYQGEIGRLMKADAAMEEERKLRRANKDTSMLYAQDNLNIDDFLDGETPNLYSVSGEDLRKEAAQYAQSASSRIYGDTRVQDINKYFQDIIQTQGYSPEAMAAWRQNLESIPEFSQAVEDIMAARGVNGNLTGANYERARQNIINGIMEGSVYQERRSPHQNPGVLTEEQRQRIGLSWANHNESVRQHNLQLKMAGYDENGVYHPENDQTLKKAAAIAKAKGTSGGKGSSTMKDTQTGGRVRFTWNGNNPSDTNGDADDDYNVEAVASDDTGHPGVLYSYDRLPTYVKKAIAPLVGDGKQHLYDYYFKPYEGGMFDDTEASIELVPRKIITQNRDQESAGDVSDSGLNDIPK